MEEDKKNGFKFSTYIGIATMLSAPIRALMCKPNTMGKRIIRSPFSLIGLAVPFGLAATTESPWMWGLLALGLIGIATQVRSKGHTFCIGESRLGDKADTAILTLTGIGLFLVDRFTGAYLVSIAFADASARWWVNRKQENQDDDVTDGMIEAKARAFRVRSKGN